MTTPVFDFHARVGTAAGATGALLSTMDRYGIARAAVCTGGVIDLDRLSRQIMEGGHVETDADNESVLDACAGAGGRLVPLYFANPHRGPRHYREVAGRFRGLEISPAVHGVPLTDARTVALVEVAAEAGHPVYVVCIGHPGCGAPALAELAARFPEVSFVLGHCGFIGIDVYSLGVVAPHPNVFAETSGCYSGIAGIAVRRLGPERVLLGTEYPLQHPAVELTKLRTLDLDPAAWRQVAWSNACRLLGEPEDITDLAPYPASVPEPVPEGSAHV